MISFFFQEPELLAALEKIMLQPLIFGIYPALARNNHKVIPLM